LCRCTGYTGIVRAVQRCGNYRDDGTCAGKGRERGTGNREQADGAALSKVRNPKSKIDSPSAIRNPQFDVVGVSIPRVDAADKVTGRALYTADIKLPNMLHGKILGSSIAHGRIRRIDVSRAAALEGVVAVITAADAPLTQHGVSPARYDENVLAKEAVRHVGDPVAAVAAVDERTAEQALALIDVQYEELPAVLDPFEAVADGAPLVHERYPQNINTHVHQDFGDVEAGFAESHHVREETFTGNHIYQCPLEPHASIAMWEHDGTLRIYTSTQVPHYVQYMLAHVFHIPLGRIRVIRPAVGGGFGGKAATTPLDLCAAVLARKTGRPVKMVYSREEMFHYGRGRHKQHMRFKLGVDHEGRIKAFKSEIYLDGGAYSSFGVATAYYAGSMMPTLYHIPNYRYDGYRVMTNKPACGAMRGHGVPQPRFAFECLLNMVAEDLGIDPIEIRRRNAMTPNSITVNDMNVGSCEFLATLDAVAAKSGWEEKYVAPSQARSLPGETRRFTAENAENAANEPENGEPPGLRPLSASSAVSAVNPRLSHVRRGIGVGSGGFVSGAGYCIYRGQVQLSHEKPPEHFQKRSIFPHANAVVKVTEDGMAAVLMIGAADIGQGSDTVLVQMCAEAMGIPPSRLRMRSEDSDISPLDLGAYSSRITLMGGHAVSRAGAAVVEKMKPYAAKLLGCDPSQVTARDGWMYAACDQSRIQSPESKIAWAEVARQYFNDNGPLVGTGCYKPPDGLGGDYKGATVGTSPAYSFGSAVCEVAVDLETGKVKVERFTDYHDCGTPVNPQAVHGQVEGAIVMSAGETIMEDVQFDAKGRLLNPNLHGYLMMTIKDAPEIFSGLVDSYEPRGPFGAKEIGEGSTLPVLGAVAHAIANATGVWIKDLPITPEKIVKALRAKRAQPEAVAS
jgi:4-hydroxybenzoyl-CoA reductase subunit alpha